MFHAFWKFVQFQNCVYIAKSAEHIIMCHFVVQAIDESYSW